MSNELATHEAAATLLRNRVAAYPTGGTRRAALWVRTFAITALIFVGPLRAGPNTSLDPSSGMFWLGLLAAVVVAVVVAVVGITEADLSVRRIQRDPDSAAIRLASRLRMLTAPGWVIRTTALGVLAGLCLGVPVALLDAAGPVVPGQPRLPSIVRFVALTIAWTVPLAFAMRYGYLRSWSRYADRCAGDPAGGVARASQSKSDPT